MKKILGIISVLMLLISVSSLALAEDEAEDETEEFEIDEETGEESEIMTSSLGAEIRLLQLEKAVTKNIIKGQEVISVLKDLGYNTTELEAILAELEFLLEEVQAADPNATDAVEVFVDLKSDAKELTKEFREALRDMLSDETLEGLQEQIRQMICEQVQNLTEKIQNRIRAYNRNQLHRLYGFIGDVNNSYLDEYENGNVTKEQVKNQIGKIISNMVKEKRNQVFLEFKESKIKTRIQAMVCVENATQNFTARKEARLEHRLQHANEQSPYGFQVREEMQNRIKNRLNAIENTGNQNINDDTHPGNNPGAGKQNPGSGKQ
jgi:Holliday junction resolvasome RuvABC DNA-binding subunit